MASEVVRASELPPEMQAFPRTMRFEFLNDDSDPSRPIASLGLLDASPHAFPDGPVQLDNGKIQGYTLPCELGEKLTDNSPLSDGYRFHDAIHIALMTRLEWSPVMRSLLRLKRRRDSRIDEIEDGARAINFEEWISDFMVTANVEGKAIEDDTSLAFATISLHNFFLKRSIVTRTPRLTEVEEALLEGVHLFRQVRQNLGGYIIASLDDKRATYSEQ